jgi:cytidylate kinase
MAHEVITIDGLAGTGKTTVARLLAKRLGYMFFSSGELYRAIGFLCLREGVNPDMSDEVKAMLDRHLIAFEVSDEKLEVAVDGCKFYKELSAPEVSDATSRAAKHTEVRKRLIELQKALADRYSLVAEGRDMGTVIYPGAKLKFFLEVEQEVKVQRRLAQMGAAEMNPEELNHLKEMMKMEISDRDERDRCRPTSPTVPAADAIVIDNSSGKLTELAENMYNMALERGLK